VGLGRDDPDMVPVVRFEKSEGGLGLRERCGVSFRRLKPAALADAVDASGLLARGRQQHLECCFEVVELQVAGDPDVFLRAEVQFTVVGLEDLGVLTFGPPLGRGSVERVDPLGRMALNGQAKGLVVSKSLIPVSSARSR